MKRHALIAAMLLLISWVFSALTAGAGEADAPASVPPAFDFTGKTVIFRLDYSTNIESIVRTAVLNEPRLVLLGDRWFVVGAAKKHPTQANPPVASEMAVVWSAISEFVIYTPDEYSAFEEQALQQQADE